MSRHQNSSYNCLDISLHPDPSFDCELTRTLSLLLLLALILDWLWKEGVKEAESNHAEGERMGSTAHPVCASWSIAELGGSTVPCSGSDLPFFPGA